ncbi:uncharacterized protein TRUGW13939_11311 [Talaromyces rugulosus]|uniref:Uncharacterized protein n=1 Tax=Talaromyces rugulosus TaxID=121627 RepID=A0A7H8RDS2_TALRU|nr:uncharacterized protein TRUGW13939_11311 [Talaromyces rugulosus]QKX64138.1 hypothetical protein TRUGW13939_11311 [Talaromyces rugulosus]
MILPPSGPNYDQVGRHFTWKTGVVRRFPVYGITYLLLAVAAILGCVAVLISSNGALVETWPFTPYPISPAVLLAIFSATTNVCLTSALHEGLNYAWWQAAIRGTTLGRLYRYWDHGNSLLASLSAGRHLSWIGVASIAVSLVVVDVPLLQRASTTRLATIYTNSTDINATMATHLAYGQTGYRAWTGSGAIMLGSLSLPTPSFHRVLDDYFAHRPISAATVTGCEGTCSGVIEAAGFYRDCTESQTQKTWFGWDGPNLTHLTPALPGVIFSTNLNWSTSSVLTYLQTNPPVLPLPDGIPLDEPYISLDMSYATATFRNDTTNQYMSNMTTKSCKLYSATRKYHVTIYNDTLSDSESPFASTINTIGLSSDSEYVADSVQNQRKDTIKAVTSLGFQKSSISSWNITGQPGVFPIVYKSQGFANPVYETLSGISTAVQGMVGSYVAFKGLEGNSTRSLFDASGSLAMQLLDDNELGQDTYFNLRWTDPSPTIFEILDELIFRCAVSAAYNNTMALLAGSNSNNYTVEFIDPTIKPAFSYPKPQLVSMSKQQTVLVYESRYLFLGIGVGIMFLSTILIVPTFYGFWKLGHWPSLNPIVAALAFRAPVLNDVASGLSSAELLRTVSDWEVQYGEVLDKPESGEKLVGILPVEAVQPLI